MCQNAQKPFEKKIAEWFYIKWLSNSTSKNSKNWLTVSSRSGASHQTLHPRAAWPTAARDDNRSFLYNRKHANYIQMESAFYIHSDQYFPIGLVPHQLVADLRHTQFSKKLDISYGSVQRTILNSLGIRKVSVRWIPRLILKEQMQYRLEVSQWLLNSFKQDSDDFLFCSSYMTNHESNKRRRSEDSNEG